MTAGTSKTGPPTALITGGGSGIGLATALRLADHGWHVMVTGRREAPLKEVAELRPTIGYTVADVTDADQARQAVDQTVAAYGRLDALVNNAGTHSHVQSAAVRVDDLVPMFATNVFAPAQLVSLCIDHLAETAGSIVNVSSAVAQRPSLGMVFYGASKAALEYLTRSWAAEFAGRRVRVNAVAPGPTETPIMDGLMPAAQLAEVKQRQAESLPLRRRGEPDEVARWVHALVDPASSWVTGQVIAVDGGMAIS